MAKSLFGRKDKGSARVECVLVSIFECGYDANYNIPALLYTRAHSPRRYSYTYPWCNASPRQTARSGSAWISQRCAIVESVPYLCGEWLAL